MRTLIRRLGKIGSVVAAAALLGCFACTGSPSLEKDARDTLRRVTAFYHDSVAVRGGFLWRYAADLSDQWGEVHAKRSEVWVQPPGTPRVGRTFLELWRTTGDNTYLEYAKNAADALIEGQLASGGWDYRIDFDAEGRTRWYYRVDSLAGEPRNGRRSISTFDDNTTQEATRLLIEVDAVIGFSDERIHNAALAALALHMDAQFPNGAWPQRYPLSSGYGGYYTFNDNTINDCIDVMLLAWETYRDDRYLASALDGGDFIILSQIDPPQAGWAQQYDHELSPAWARAFEPRAVCSSVTLRNIATLIDLYTRTNESRFLDPIPAAMEWLNGSVVEVPEEYFAIRKIPSYERGWARFYEIGTNQPLFGDRDGEVHYTFAEISEERQRGYSWYRPATTNVFEKYARARDIGAAAYRAESHADLTTDAKLERIASLEPRVREVIASLDERGCWVENGEIQMRTFVSNVRVLEEYLRLHQD